MGLAQARPNDDDIPSTRMLKLALACPARLVATQAYVPELLLASIPNWGTPPKIGMALPPGPNQVYVGVGSPVAVQAGGGLKKVFSRIVRFAGGTVIRGGTVCVCVCEGGGEAGVCIGVCVCVCVCVCVYV